MHPLDNPVWDALNGPQRAVAEIGDLAARFRPEISAFGAFPEPPGPEHWRAMAHLVGPGGTVIVTGHTGTPPEGWSTEYAGDGVQMTGEAVGVRRAGAVALRPEQRMLPLGAADADDMVELVELARPGPFSPRTWELGGYVGVRVDGHLAAMAGRRFRPTGWCEISAVATHPDHRRQGLAAYLVRVVALNIVTRGEVPLLHVAADNRNAIRLYETMGFTHRRVARFVAVRAPGGPDGPDAPGLPRLRG